MKYAVLVQQRTAYKSECFTFGPFDDIDSANEFADSFAEHVASRARSSDGSVYIFVNQKVKVAKVGTFCDRIDLTCDTIEQYEV